MPADKTSYDILQVISSSSATQFNFPKGTSLANRRTSMPETVNYCVKHAEKRRSVIASDGIGVHQLSPAFHITFDRNGPDRTALRRRHTIDMESKDSNRSLAKTSTLMLPPPSRIQRRRPLIRQQTSVQSDDSAFADDLCNYAAGAELDETSKQFISTHRRMEEMINQISIDEEENGDLENQEISDHITTSEHSNDCISSHQQLMKLRSASVDSGYLDTASSVSSNVWSSDDANDGLTVVDEDEYQQHEDEDDDVMEEDRLSLASSRLSLDEEFSFSAKELLNRFLKGKREPAADASETLSPRAVKRVLENIKKFIRHNDWPVSHEIREDLWRVLCNYKDFESNKLLYQQQLSELLKTGVKTLTPAFLSSDGIVVHDHGLKQQGAVALQHVLIVIECVRPELRFVPILYPLCSTLLHYMKPDETFASIVRFLGTGSNFLIQSDVSLYASFHTLLALLKKHRRSAYNFLKRRVGSSDDAQLVEVFRPWYEWIFKHLPFDYLVRIIDCYLVEGHKMLLRVVLSLVYLWYKQRVKSAPTATAGSTPEARVEEIAAQITIICQNCPISVQTLLDMGFSIRNFKHSTIDHLQKHFEDKYREEVHKMRLEKSGQPMVQAQRNMYTAAFESLIIDSDSACELMSALPSRFQLETPVLLFRLSEHGASFTQLWAQIDDAEQSLLIIRSTRGEIFGAYCSSCWSERKDVRERVRTRYFGTGESFVFKQPKGQLFPTIYPWVGRNNEHPGDFPQMFMAAGDRFLIIGSGGGDAIAIRDELTRGLSYTSETFGNRELVTDNSFEIDELEVFGVVNAGAI